jgi:peroxiredoxin
MRLKNYHPVILALLALPITTVMLCASADEKLIGTEPPEWQVSDWVNSKPITLKEQAGKVVLVRWWTSPYCRDCKATAPALNEFHTKYKDQGLVVIGLYHHKAPIPLRPSDVKRYAQDLGFEFPVAVDHDWMTLKRWWLDDHKRAWTSVSFLIDRKGVIRYVHPGGQYVRGDEDYKAMRAKVEELLSEK